MIHHLSGSKANQIETFPLSQTSELILGRDPSAAVRYDLERDDVVGRQHARIEIDRSNPAQFMPTDLNSRNGTFVNRQKITGTVRLHPGDVVQLGLGGPEFQFDIEPRPPEALKETRIVAESAPPTRISTESTAIPQRPSSFVDKATVERMIAQNVGETQRRQSRAYLLIGGAALLAVLVIFGAVAAYLSYRNRATETQVSQEVSRVQAALSEKESKAPLAATEIAQKNGKAVVYIEVSWELISTKTGGLGYHQFLPNDKGQLMKVGPPVIPAYVQVAPDKIEPYLTYDHNRS